MSTTHQTLLLVGVAIVLVVLAYMYSAGRLNHIMQYGQVKYQPSMKDVLEQPRFFARAEGLEAPKPAEELTQLQKDSMMWGTRGDWRWETLSHPPDAIDPLCGDLCIIYSEKRYTGVSQPLTPGFYKIAPAPLPNPETPEIVPVQLGLASLRVPRGFAVVAFENDDWTGKQALFRQSEPDLERVGFLNNVRSLEVRELPGFICMDPGYQAEKTTADRQKLFEKVVAQIQAEKVGPGGAVVMQQPKEAEKVLSTGPIMTKVAPATGAV